MNRKELVTEFEEGLMETNRGYSFFVDWNNITGLDEYNIEIHAMDVLIRQDESKFRDEFFRLLKKVPDVVELFPLLIAISKEDRKKITKDKNLVIACDETYSSYKRYNFNGSKFKNELSEESIKNYYEFFVNTGLKYLFQNLIEKSVRDYIVGVLVGLDSNGRKNRGGKIFEIICESIIREVCDKYDLLLLTQKQFKVLAKYGMSISSDIANRKADFIIVNRTYTKCMNIEVNFFNNKGSKPEEIIDSYINRQADLDKVGIKFGLITDGKCWKGTTNQLNKGFSHLEYLMNFKLAKEGMIEEMIAKEFDEIPCRDIA
ncbi:type II restriction endonuclease [Butyrivibrio fibrisolvens]|uniref:DpnII family type II restriction endonuclease n=1 Tax=Pseudobutyrivibrio ruminis TaxID=46206 RepID=UPI0004056533|nr:DpnII family type II restriction endonuclease [Pseudobutyrivibrio ruminis]MDC7280775.1 type II restriction endonuclease [Butyrivibrio fibrisolvens]